MIAVRKITDMAEALQLVPVRMKLWQRGRLDTDIKDFLTIVQMGINDPLFGLWIAYDDDIAVGYACANVNAIKIYGLDYAFVIEMGGDKRGISNDLLKVIIEWAKEHKVNKVRTISKRHWKSIGRLYNFKPVSVIIERRI